MDFWSTVVEHQSATELFYKFECRTCISSSKHILPYSKQEYLPFPKTQKEKKEKKKNCSTECIYLDNIYFLSHMLDRGNSICKTIKSTCNKRMSAGEVSNRDSIITDFCDLLGQSIPFSLCLRSKVRNLSTRKSNMSILGNHRILQSPDSGKMFVEIITSCSFPFK